MGEVLGSEYGNGVDFSDGMPGGNIYVKLEVSPPGKLLGVEVGHDIGSSSGISGRQLQMCILNRWM